MQRYTRRFRWSPVLYAAAIVATLATAAGFDPSFLALAGDVALAAAALVMDAREGGLS